MKTNLLFIVLILIIGNLSFTIAQTTFSSSSQTFSSTSGGVQTSMPTNYNYYSSAQIETYWPILKQMEEGKCQEGTDFIVSIPPGGCSPAVVRSDLLEDQNVPVFCKLSAIKVNPLIQVSSIKSISFQGKKPEGVVDIQFHPAQAAIRSYQSLLGSPLINNIGYVVIVLKRNKVEKNMTEWIFGNLTATIYYDVDKAYGTGKAEYYVPVMTDDDWNMQFRNYGFWNGQGFIRTMDISDNTAKIGLYLDKDNKFTEITLTEGQQSKPLFFPFSYCKAGMQVKLNKIDSEEQQAKLNLDGDTIWVRKGSKFFDGVCSVSDLNVLPDKTGTVQINCRNQPRISLALLPKGASLKVTEEQDKSVRVGENVIEPWVLAYAGKIPSIVGDIPIEEDREFIVLIKRENKGLDVTAISKKISDSVFDIANQRITGVFNFKQFESQIKSAAGFNAVVIKKGSSQDIDISGGKKNIIFNQLLQATSDRDFAKENMERGVVLEEYVQKLEASLDYLLGDYQNEKEPNTPNARPFGEQALRSLIVLYAEIGKQEKVQKFGERYLGLYSNFAGAEEIRNMISRSALYDLSQSQARVLINNAYHYLSLEEVKPLERDSKKITLWVSGFGQKETSEKQVVYMTESADEKTREKSDYVYVDKVSVNSADVIYHKVTEVVKDSKSSVGSSVVRRPSSKEGYEILDEAAPIVTLKLNEPAVNKFGVRLELKDIQLKRVAYISLNPHIDSTKSTANFTFRIGIEKRDIKLSDEKTKDMIKNINESIKRWEEINTKLGNLIKAWKGACFATSMVLMVKSGVAGFSGQSIARQKVMEAYKQHCRAQHSEMTSTQCYNEHAPGIDSDVTALTSSISNTNNDIKAWQEGECRLAAGSLFSGAVVDDSCVKKKMQQQLKNTKYREGYVNIKDSNGQDVNVSIDKIDDYDTLKVLLTEDLSYSTATDTNVVGEFYNKKKESLLAPIQEQQKREEALAKAIAQSSNVFEALGGSSGVVSVGAEPTNTGAWEGHTWSQLSGGKSFLRADIKPTDFVQRIELDGNLYVATLNPDLKGSSYTIDQIYQVTKEKLSLVQKCLTGTIFTSSSPSSSPECKLDKVRQEWRFVSGGGCSNTYKKPKVRFYDSGNSKGMPGIVPVDTKTGWYAKISQSPGGMFSTQVQGYKQSAEVNFFYLCNVGANGFEENAGGDDICQSVDANNYPSEFRLCPTLTKTQLKALIDRANRAIRDAASKYSSASGGKTISLLGGEISAEVDQPMGGEQLTECQDFMSPTDCKILFNVCDPVICPASRCNLRGKYPVSDVIQTGIIGSLFLCLPNIQEGVMVPICLSGIYAGIESFVSILKSERDCLIKSLQTGEHVGICDEITSIYLCEFFWRQLAPVMNILIPKMIETAYGQGTRGGGEYLSVQTAWNSMQGSIDYFKNTYAQNAFRAFQFRNVEEAGGTFCKAFVGTSFPTSANALDSLLDPESPEQVYAWFSESSYTEATVPATSHYKVYYHIFAGNDQGTQFRVYLRNPPSSSYYSSTGVINVKTGYITKGDSADEAIDFTAPSGYKELCVDLDAQTRCGFNSVSTDFAVDYLSKKYTEAQATTGNITSERECISGSASLYSLATPNLQAGAEQIVNPTANLNGIVRICSTNNPGKATDSQTQTTESTMQRVVDAGGSVSGAQTVSVNFNKKWQKVGYCDNPNIGCWLDTESVKKDVQAVQAIENGGMTMADLENELKKMSGEQSKFTEKDASSGLSTAEKNIKELNLKDALNDKNTKDQIRAAINTKINEIESSLILLGGEPGASAQVAKAPNTAQIAKAISLRTNLYIKVIETLFESFKKSGVVSTGFGVTSDSDAGAAVNSVAGGETITTAELSEFEIDDKGKIWYSAEMDKEDTGLILSEFAIKYKKSVTTIEVARISSGVISISKDVDKNLPKTNSARNFLNKLVSEYNYVNGKFVKKTTT